MHLIGQAIKSKEFLCSSITLPVRFDVFRGTGRQTSKCYDASKSYLVGCNKLLWNFLPAVSCCVSMLVPCFLQ